MNIANYNPFEIPLESGRMSRKYGEGVAYWSQGTLDVQNTILEAIGEHGKASGLAFATYQLATDANGTPLYSSKMTWEQFQNKLMTKNTDPKKTVDHRFFREYGTLIVAGFSEEDEEGMFGQSTKTDRFEKEVAEHTKNSEAARAA